MQDGNSVQDQNSVPDGNSVQDQNSVPKKLWEPPWWALSLMMGAPFGTMMTVFSSVQHSGSWTRSIISGGIGGVLFGCVMGPLFARQRRKLSALFGDLPRRDLRVASRAVMRGPVPLDPDIRQAAVKLAAEQLKSASRFRWLGLVLFSFLAVISLILAVTDSPRWWVAVAIYATLVAAYQMWPGHVKRRIEFLSQGV